MNLYQFMLLYQDIFNPKYFLLFSLILIVIYDWKNSDRNIRHLFGRFAVISISYAIGFVIVLFLLQQLSIKFSDFPQYLEDFSAVFGLTTGLTLCLVFWRMLGYGKALICGAIGLIAVIVPYTIISYIWNISGHVTFTASPVTYLSMLDKRLIPLYAIPVIMVFNRPIVGAHDLVQSIAGFILGTSLMIFGVKMYLWSKKVELL